MTTTATEQGRRQRLLSWLQSDVDGAGLAVFRIAFGIVLAGSAVRFWAKGWVKDLYITPSIHFTYPGFSWVKPLDGIGLYIVFGVMAAAALLVAAGAWYRTACAVLFATFTYVELLDQAYYLNHYYLVSLITFLLCFIPADRVWSCNRREGNAVKRWHTLLLRAQIGLVYTFAGLAKLNKDWLFRAEPLAQWLPVHSDLPIIGFMLAIPATAFVASWLGAAYDLAIPWLVAWRRTRWVSVAAIVAFHLGTLLLFNIGAFPFVMLAASTLMLPPQWPRLAHPVILPVSGPRDLNITAGLVFAGLFLVMQILLPLRHLLLSDDVNWTAKGFRFSWRVMLAERTGQVEFRVQERHGLRRWLVQPRTDLTQFQTAMLATEPDLIADYATVLATRFRTKGIDVAVFADSWLSMNGRPAQRYLDASVDLSRDPPALFARQ